MWRSLSQDGPGGTGCPHPRLDARGVAIFPAPSLHLGSRLAGVAGRERIAARACAVYRKCVGVPDRDVQLSSSSTGGANPGALVPGVSCSGSTMYLGL